MNPAAGREGLSFCELPLTRVWLLRMRESEFCDMEDCANDIDFHVSENKAVDGSFLMGLGAGMWCPELKPIDYAYR